MLCKHSTPHKECILSVLTQFLCASLTRTLSACVFVCVVQWALAKDGTGNYYYYNMSNSQMTVTELPDVTDAVSEYCIYSVCVCIYVYGYDSVQYTMSELNFISVCVCVCVWPSGINLQAIRASAYMLINSCINTFLRPLTHACCELLCCVSIHSCPCKLVCNICLLSTLILRFYRIWLCSFLRNCV